MGYLSIDNLYKPEAQKILVFKELYALEKVHGTSAHIKWDGEIVIFFSGGEAQSKFKALFDEPKLAALFKEKFDQSSVTIYGEAYGGKQQGMSATYGPNLKFVAFDVLIDQNWLSVPQAHDLCTSFGLEFVDYCLVSSDLASLNLERDKPSTQAVRNGILEPKLREGIVLRPPFECYTNRGRLIAKHKGEAFAEREKPIHEIDPAQADEQTKAEAIAFEWATPMRLEHIIDHLIRDREDKSIGMEDTKALIKEMIEDVKREIVGDVDFNPKVNKAIGARTAKLLKAKLEASIEY